MLLRLILNWRRVLWTLGIAAALSGCVTRVMPPPHPSDPLPVFIADYGRHSSIILPDGRGRLIEYAYGDWEWFALNENKLSDALRALFYSRHSTLGRRKLLAPASRPAVAQELQVKHVEEFTATRARIDALMDELDTRIDSHADTRVFNEQVQMWFVQDEQHYGIWNNCNDMTAHWLKLLGCTTAGNGWTADFRVAEPKE